ncbi:hypothetical protein MPSEU_000546500 [Mayamaea pseudoterrestris]|nr:hypothetical protein MPSEU_000546500 [Mayamaea pseudoterrestris]
MISSSFRETTSADACTLTDGVRLHSVHENVILPWIGYGTYRLGKEQASKATLQALECGYRAIDTAFIYGGEQNCRRRPAWSTMNRRNDVVAEDPWHYATTSANEMAKLRSETWRAMEDSVRAGQVRAIGVSNMTVQHLMKLKETAELWPPAVNQVELHPLYPQTGLFEYCAKEGIVLQAYSSLGGQDTGQAKWKELLGSGVQFERGSDEKTTLSTKKVNKQPKAKFDLLHASPVLDLAHRLQVTPAQVLLRWALDQNCPVIPKTISEERMMENANALKAGQLSSEQVGNLRDTLLQQLRINNPEAVADGNDSQFEAITRLAWRRDPLRHLAFE